MPRCQDGREGKLTRTGSDKQPAATTQPGSQSASQPNNFTRTDTTPSYIDDGNDDGSIHWKLKMDVVVVVVISFSLNILSLSLFQNTIPARRRALLYLQQQQQQQQQLISFSREWPYSYENLKKESSLMARGK